jgi:hypothetical protein
MQLTGICAHNNQTRAGRYPARRIKMSSLLTHRFENQQFEVKVTPCHHHLMRQRYRDCSGVQLTNWQRVSVSTVQQLRSDSIETLMGEINEA